MVSCRSIPAYAGDPVWVSLFVVKLWVYPRLRGGSKEQAIAETASAGLSPPTRGILVKDANNQGYVGSIPAYAGDPRR